jgi:hypothetical protein
MKEMRITKILIRDYGGKRERERERERERGDGWRSGKMTEDDDKPPQQATG